MKLRDRLLLFGTAQLAVFGVLFALVYGAFEWRVLPTFRAMARAKSERITQTIGADLDIPVGADDRPALVRVVADLLRDPDFVALISNARQALKDHRSPPQQLTVQARREGARLTIRVSDTGVGIPAENLAKIFGHGFTTRPGGHGFGLHASANAGRELGGTLHAASAGPGHGATFTLELPAELAPGDGVLAN